MESKYLFLTAFIVMFSILIAIVPKTRSEDSDIESMLRITAETLAGAAVESAMLYTIWTLEIGTFNAATTDELIKYRLIPDYITMTLGSAIGVYLVGVLGNEKGSFRKETESFLATFGYSVLGIMVFGGSFLFSGTPVVLRSDYDTYSCCLAPGGWCGALMGALVGFNVTRDSILVDRTVQAAPAIRLNVLKMQF